MSNEELIDYYLGILISPEQTHRNYTGLLSNKPDQKFLSDQRARVIITYAITTFLYDWSPQKLYNYMSENIAKRLNLDVPFQYIIKPTGVSDKDYSYIAKIVYPNKFSKKDNSSNMDSYYHFLEKKEEIEDDFDNGYLSNNGYVLEELKKGRLKENTLPKEYFTDSIGEYRLNNALVHYIQNKIIPSNKEELYRHFATQGIEEELEEWGLSAWKRYYDSTIDFLHFSLREESRDTNLYTKYKQIAISNIAKGKEQQNGKTKRRNTKRVAR